MRRPPMKYDVFRTWAGAASAPLRMYHVSICVLRQPRFYHTIIIASPNEKNR